MGKRQPPFTEEEMVLLLYWYMKHREEIATSKSPFIVALSKILRELPIHPERIRRQEAFRNPVGIALQFLNVSSLDCRTTEKRHTSKRMRDFWSIYSNNTALLYRDAKYILKKYNITQYKEDIVCTL